MAKGMELFPIEPAYRICHRPGTQVDLPGEDLNFCLRFSLSLLYFGTILPK